MNISITSFQSGVNILINKTMEKAYNISEIRFENNQIILNIDNQLVKLNLSIVSQKLANATEAQLYDYKISPSGYGISWKQLDEDLSINGLLKLNTSNPQLKHAG